MPELPEVETVARGLQKQIAGRRILSITFGKTDFIDNPGQIEKELPGRAICGVVRYGKFLLLRLTAKEDAGETDRESALLVHLGMTGMLRTQPAGEAHTKHTHVVALLDDGRELRYTDPRRFGRMAYLAGGPLQEELRRFGADPLEAGLEEFTARIRGKRARIKALLLDQRVLRGVGNIYADESLWKARIHPKRLGARLRKEQVKELYRALQGILERAIVMRGSSIADFLDVDGQPGEYQRHHRAYGREGKPCFRCKTQIKRVIVAGRSSYFCPQCQKAPRSGKRHGGKAQKYREERLKKR